MKSKNLVVILTVGPETQKCVDWLNEELSRKSTLKNVDVKTIEQSRGLEFPALLTISTEGKIAMELSESHITGDFFCFTMKKSWALKIFFRKQMIFKITNVRVNIAIVKIFLFLVHAGVGGGSKNGKILSM